LLEKLKNIPENEKTCRYTGVLVVYNPETKEFWDYVKHYVDISRNKKILS
jgi:hypothetical protein